MIDQNKLIYFFSNLEKHQLPGHNAHIELTPYRKKFLPEPSSIDYKNGAVAIILSFYGDSPTIILTKRAKYDGVHSGQISFPGGKIDKNDLDLQYTAQRETREETGIILDDTNFITKLSEIYIPPSNFLVHPYFFISRSKIIGVENNEVDYLIELPLTHIINTSELDKSDIKLYDGTILKNAPCFIYKNEIIWGATAAILNELRWLLKKI